MINMDDNMAVIVADEVIEILKSKHISIDHMNNNIKRVFLDYSVHCYMTFCTNFVVVQNKHNNYIIYYSNPNLFDEIIDSIEAILGTKI